MSQQARQFQCRLDAAAAQAMKGMVEADTLEFSQEQVCRNHPLSSLLVVEVVPRAAMAMEPAPMNSMEAEGAALLLKMLDLQ